MKELIICLVCVITVLLFLIGADLHIIKKIWPTAYDSKKRGGISLITMLMAIVSSLAGMYVIWVELSMTTSAKMLTSMGVVIASILLSSVAGKQLTHLANKKK